jgi:hypothetical protein
MKDEGLIHPSSFILHPLRGGRFRPAPAYLQHLPGWYSKSTGQTSAVMSRFRPTRGKRPAREREKSCDSGGPRSAQRPRRLPRLPVRRLPAAVAGLSQKPGRHRFPTRRLPSKARSRRRRQDSTLAARSAGFAPAAQLNTAVGEIPGSPNDCVDWRHQLRILFKDNAAAVLPPMGRGMEAAVAVSEERRVSHGVSSTGCRRRLGRHPPVGARLLLAALLSPVRRHAALLPARSCSVL